MSRRVGSYFDLKINSRAKSRAEGNKADFPAEPISMLEICNMVDFLFVQNGDRFLYSGKIEKSPSFYLADVARLNDFWVLLINKCDPGAPDSVYSNPEKKERKVIAKALGEGAEYSAHLIINTLPIKPDVYFCAIESPSGCGLASASISEYFAHVIRHCKKNFPERFKVENIDGTKDKKGNPNLVSTYYGVELLGHLSSTFVDDLEKGYLSEIEVIDLDDVGVHWDSSGFVTERSKVVKLKLEKNLIGDAVRTVRAVINNAKNKGLSQVRVRFLDSSGSPNSALISTDTGLVAGGDSYVKKHYISKANNIGSYSVEKVNHAIVKEVLSALE